MFLFHQNGREYAVSANHVFSDVENAKSVEILHEGIWKSIDARLVGRNVDRDVAVIALDHSIVGADLALEASLDLILGQDIYLVGFPLGMWGDMGSIFNGYPAPFVKRGTLSMFTGEADRLFLDAVNNRGMSGSPVIGLGFPANPLRPHLLGIVTSNVPLSEPVRFHGRHHGHEIQLSAGICQAASIVHAQRLIEECPIGPVIRAT